MYILHKRIMSIVIAVNTYLIRIDDVVIINDAIEMIDNMVDVPTEYLMTMLDPALDEDIVGWEDLEPEYSRKDHIIHLTEWKRMNTRNINEQIQIIINSINKKSNFRK